MVIMRGIGPLNEMLDIREDEGGAHFVLYPLDVDTGQAYWGTHYPVRLEEYEGGFKASTPALPRLIAKAKEREEAKRGLADAIKAYLRRIVPLIPEYIVEGGPHHDGDARIDVFGIAVWALIGHLEAVHADIKQTAEDYEIPVEAVEAAHAYYLLNKPIVDARRAANRARSVA